MRSWSVRRAAVLVAALTVGSTVLGFLRDVVIGAVFGAGPSLDAYLVAQGVMNIVLGLISGAMARSLTPVIARQANECSSAGSCAGHRTIGTGRDVRACGSRDRAAGGPVVGCSGRQECRGTPAGVPREHSPPHTVLSQGTTGSL